MEYVLTRPAGFLILPTTGAPRCAVLVLSGSSGRIEVDRARMLAAHGAAAICLRWFGDAGQPPGICEVALETFRPALDRLAGLSRQVAVLGSSKGAEAALLLAVRDPRIAATAAFSPTSVAWANVGAGADGLAYPYRSSWTDAGVPVPFVPYDEAWQPTPGRPAYRGLYEQSLRTFADRAEQARIPVERIAGRVLLTAGGDDQVWPSDWFAEQIVARRSAHGLATDLIHGLHAGHAVRLPGEPAGPAGGPPMERGGTATADAALGHRVWPALLGLLGLQHPTAPGAQGSGDGAS
ncbi:MAG TPA: acyl-CoA thioester hydrolase/BAAT C-terminal domain-containing protein [Candidatus Dormibacteraeota bacterium]|nr:acyl-CoA thioester hydrolase/BAAT C-terminal domain-containing protein [Candidatus Dormibacteraeota bacterium]